MTTTPDAPNVRDLQRDLQPATELLIKALNALVEIAQPRHQVSAGMYAESALEALRSIVARVGDAYDDALAPRVCPKCGTDVPLE